MSTDRAELVHQLQATLSKMEVALGAITDAVVFLNADSQVQWCNSAFEQLVKRSHSTIVGSKFSELLPLMQAGQSVAPDAYPDVKRREGGYEATEYEVVQGDRPLGGAEGNRSLVLHISGNCVEQSDRPLGGAKGNRSTVLVIRDITQAKQQEAEHKKALQERDESLSLLRATLESTADGILVVNQERSIPLYNQKFLQMWGIPDSLLVAGKEDEPLLFGAQQTKDPEGFIAKVQDIVLHHPQAVILDVVELKDGRVFERYSKPQWQSDQIIGRVWNYRDITAHKQTEEALFRTIVENANDVIGIVNLEGIVRYISPNVVNLTGFTAAEMEGQSFEPFMHPDEVPKLYEAFNQLATTGERISGLEYRAKHKAGGCKWQMTNLSAFRDASGELFIIGVVRDITERKQAEEALKASEARLNAILNSAVASIQRNRFYSDRSYIFEYSDDQKQYSKQELQNGNS
jgi:two-component system, sensor histidine kinase and response regulator